MVLLRCTFVLQSPSQLKEFKFYAISHFNCFILVNVCRIIFLLLFNFVLAVCLPGTQQRFAACSGQATMKCHAIHKEQENKQLNCSFFWRISQNTEQTIELLILNVISF